MTVTGAFGLFLMAMVAFPPSSARNRIQNRMVAYGTVNSVLYCMDPWRSIGPTRAPFGDGLSRAIVKEGLGSPAVHKLAFTRNQWWSANEGLSRGPGGLGSLSKEDVWGSFLYFVRSGRSY